MLKKFLCTVSRILSRLVTFGLETKRARPSRVSSRLVTRRLDLVSSRDFRLVTNPNLGTENEKGFWQKRYQYVW